MDLNTLDFLESVDETDDPKSSNVLSPKILTGDQRCHNFQSQNVFTSQHEPLVLCSTDDQVFLATQMENGNCQIQVRYLSDPGCPVLHTFPTITPVKTILYNNVGNYIATLEEKRRGLKCDTFSHVYINWHVASHGDQRLRARIAGRVSDLSVCENSIEVIELATKQGPNAISTCQRTGNIAISWGNAVSIFKYVERQHEQIKYKDFTRIMEIDFNFFTKHCNLNEDVLAVCSDDCIQIVRITLMDKSRLHSEAVSEFEARDLHIPATSNSVCPRQENVTPAVNLQEYIVIDDDATIWNFVDEHDTETRQEIDLVHPPSIKRGVHLPGSMLPKLAYLPTLQEAVEKDAQMIVGAPLEVYGPKARIPGYAVNVNLKDATVMRDFDARITNLLLRRFPILDTRLHTIELLPVYTSDMPDIEDPEPVKPGLRSLDPLKSAHYRNLTSMCCFISNEWMGYLYTLMDKTDLICTYPYAETTSKVGLTDTLVHTVTKKGLLTYTGRHFVPALHNLKTFDQKTTTCPSPYLDITLLGTQPFIGIESIGVASSHVVLLNKVHHLEDSGDDESSWSMYALKSSTIAGICAEVHELTRSLRYMSSTDHLHLLQESQLLLQYALLHGREMDVILPLFYTCSSMLADYYSTVDHQDSSLCVPYYRMSGKTVTEVINSHHKQFLESIEMKFDALPLSSDFGPGFVTYLLWALFEQDAVSVSTTVGDCLLLAVAARKPDKLAEVIAVSQLKNYTDVHAEQLLSLVLKRYPMRADPMNVIAHAILKLRLGELGEAEAMLASLSKAGLISVFSKHHQLLHVDLTQWTDVAHVVRKRHHDAFTQILVNLLDMGVFGLNSTVVLLEGVGEVNQGHLKEYLEAVLNDKTREKNFSEAAILLSKIYISSLRIQPGPKLRNLERIHSHVPRGDGHFSKRYPWLDHLPPFYDPASVNRPCLLLRKSSPNGDAGDCRCCCCHEDLLKLQALLCSPHTSTTLLHNVLSELKNLPELKCHDALVYLCEAKEDVLRPTDKMLAAYPSVVPVYARNMFGSNTKMWSQLMDKVWRILRQTQQDSDSTYHAMLKELLQDMSELLPVCDFLRLLPPDGNLAVFLPYLEKSYKANDAVRLKEKLAKNGELLYSQSEHIVGHNML